MDVVYVHAYTPTWTSPKPGHQPSPGAHSLNPSRYGSSSVSSQAVRKSTSPSMPRSRGFGKSALE